MREYSLSSGQLKSFRRRQIFQLTLLFFLMFGISLTIFILFILGAFKYNENKEMLSFFSWLYGNLLVTIIVGVVLLLVLFVPFSILYRKLYLKKNHQFHQKYLDMLFAECKYNEVNYAFRKRTVDKDLFKELEELLSINNIETKYVLSDANPKRYLEYHQIEYNKEDKIKKRGVVLIYRNTSYLEGIFQIRTKGEPLKKNYLEKDIQRFGFTRHTALKKYEIYSSLGSQTYKYEKNELADAIEELKNFIRCDFAITRKNAIFTLFLEGFEFNLTNGLFSKYHPNDFDSKVDALLHLHKLVDEVIDQMMTSN